LQDVLIAGAVAGVSGHPFVALHVSTVLHVVGVVCCEAACKLVAKAVLDLRGMGRMTVSCYGREAGFVTRGWQGFFICCVACYNSLPCWSERLCLQATTSVFDLCGIG